jgi:hypothetical protein
MGAGKSNSSKKAEVGKASEFYWACRHGNYRKVKNLISRLNYEQLSQIEQNGSTALHAATYYGHYKIVQLLLDQGCSRTTLNRYGHTAYDEVQNEQMRSLFTRPSSQRFVDDDPAQSFGLTSNSDDNDETKDGVPDNWVKGYANKNGAHEANFMHAIARAPLLMRKVLQTRLEDESKESLETFLDTNVDREEPMYDRVRSLFDEFKNKRNIESLFTLYTLETPIYRALQDDCKSFTALLYMHLPDLKDRAYTGITYRGGRMTENDIQAYRWALAQEGRVLETRTIQSTSKNKRKALEFAEKPNHSKPLAVLLIFDFPELCRTAIDLNKVSETKTVLSEFQDEEEVTLLPFTLFKVAEIKVDKSANKQYRITLRNVPVKKKSISGAWLNMS